MNTRGVAVGLVAVLLLSAVGGVFVGNVGAASSIEVTANSSEAGTTTGHNISIETDSNEEGSSLNSVVIDYNNSTDGSSFDLGSVEEGSISAIGIGRSHGNISTNVHDDIESVYTEDGGTRLVIELSGNYGIGPGDSSKGSYVTVRFDGVTNPQDEGTYDILGDLNGQSQSGDDWQTGTLEIDDTTPPDVGITLTADEAGGLEAVVGSNEKLNELNVSVDGSEGTVRSLSLDENFTQSGSVGSGWTYTASVTDVVDDDYTATVGDAVDLVGNDIENSVSNDATLDTKPIRVDNVSVSPNNADGYETVDQTIDVDISQASAYGDDETVTLSVNDTAEIENASVSITNGSGAEVNPSSINVDNGTITADVNSGDGSGTVDYTVRYDINASYTVEGPSKAAFEATADDSDGSENTGTTTVPINDVTSPEITNFTLVNDGQDVDLELNVTEKLGDANINLTRDAGGTLSLSNASGGEDNGDTWRYVFDVSEGMDGDFKAEVGGGESASYYVADTADTSNKNRGSNESTTSVNEDDIEVAGANVTNAVVDRGETVDHTVTVDVENVSKDGNDDTVQIVFPAGKENVSLNDVGANVIDDSTTTVNGGTAFNATINPGDGGGVADVNVAYNVTATYPDSLEEGSVHAVNASAFDSDGSSDGPDNHTHVEVRKVPPVITDFELFQQPADSQDVNLRFNASEKLGAAEVSFEDDLVGERDNLTLADDTIVPEGETDGNWTYTADVNEGDDGQFNASLGAEDESGIVAEGDLDANLTVSETDPIVTNATVDPRSVQPGETANQTVTASVDGFSRDGSTDQIEVTFSEGVDVQSTDWIGVSGANGGSVDSIENRTVTLDVESSDGLGTANVTAEFDAEIDYASELEGEDVPLNVTADDSDGAENTRQNETHVAVADTNPVISNFTLNETGDGVALSFDSTEALDDVTVTVTGELDGELALGRSDFDQSAADGNWTYTNASVLSKDGTYNATLDEGAALDSDDNANPENHSDGVVVDNYAIDVVDANVTAEPVDPNSTVDQRVTVDVHNVSRDGVSDTVEVTFNNSADVTAANVSSTVGSADLTDAENLTAEVATGSGGGVDDLTLTYNVTAAYPPDTEGTTLDVDASAEDSDGASDNEANVTSVRVRDTIPEITNFTLFQQPDGSQGVNLRFNASEKLGSANVSFNDDLAGETRSLGENVSLVETVDSTYVYEADVNEGADGEFDADLTAADPAGNDAEGDLDANLTVNETDPVVTNATIEPASAQPGETLAQNLTASVDGFSRDGGSDTIRVEFGAGVDVASASALEVTDRNGDSASGENVTAVDNRTVEIGVDSGDGLGTADVTATFDAEVTYRHGTEGEGVPLNVTADDSDGASNTSTNATHVDVADTNPEISNFTLNETESSAALSFDATEQLEEVTVELDGDTSRTLERGDFSETAIDGSYTYTNASVVDRDGIYTASLDAGDATDSDDNGNNESHTSSVEINENAIDVVDANVTDELVDPQSTVTQQVIVDVEDVSLDGENDTADVAFNDSVDVTAENVTSDRGSASLVDGTENLTAEVATGSGGGVTDLTLTYNVTATYDDALEGETLAVDASATDSDGDSDEERALTNVSVRDTHPVITNFTLTNESRDVDLSLTSTEALEAVSVTTDGDSPQSELTRGNFTETERDGNFSYEANVSDGIDGTFNATLAAGDAVDNAGNGNNESHEANITVDTRDVTVVSATATPDSVAPESTVEQNLTVSAENFGQDGGTDTLTLTLNESLNVTAVTSKAVTVGEASVDDVERLDVDDDGAAERLRISLDTGSDGGTTDVTAAVNATVAYPDTVEGATLPIDASADDSDGSSDEATALTNVSVDDVPPTIANFSLNATGQDVDLSLEASEPLTTTEIALGGDLNDTLTDLNERRVAEDEWVYSANVSDGEDGYFAAELTSAVDRFSNDGADGETDSVRVNAVGPKIQQTRISPDRLRPEERTNQSLTTNVTGLSRDGVNDTVSYEFANESTVAVENVSAIGANASAVVTDNATAVLVNVSTGNDTGSANVTLTTNLTATYDNRTEGETYNVTTLVNDSLNETAGPMNTTVAVNDTVPAITAFNLTAEGQDVNLTVTSNESLATLNASLGGDLNETLTRGNFTETAETENFSYEANVSDGVDGNFTAELTNATDPFGNNATVGQNDSVVVDTENVSAADLNVTPSEVRPNATVDGTATLNVSDLNRDDRNDTATVTFGNGTDVLAVNASVDDANTTAAVTNVSDANGDTLNETVTLGVNTTDALGSANLTLALNTTTAYDDWLEGTNVSVDAAVNDSDGSNATAATNVTVVDTVPTVEAFDVALNGSAAELTMRADEPLETVRVALSGATGGNLTRADFDAAREDDGISYTTTLADGRQGTFGAELAAAVDDSGNDGAEEENDSVTVRFGGGGGGGQQAGGGGGQQQTQQTEETNVTRVDNSTDGAPLSVRIESIEDGREVLVENAREDVDVNAHLTPTDTEDAAGVALSDVGLTTTTNGTPTLQVRHDRSATFDTLPDRVNPVIAYETDGEGVTNATYTVRVADDRLGERSPDMVEIYEVDGSDLNATYTGETVDQHNYRIDAGVERFSVAIAGANVTVVDAGLPAANESGVAPGANPRNATVNVTLRNTGPVAGNHTVTVTAANEPLVQRTVEVAANSSRTVQLAANVSALDQEGPTLIEANEVKAGTIPSSFDVDSTATEGDSPFAMATLLVVLAGAALLARRE